MKYKKYKDALPQDTVDCIKKIYKEINLDMQVTVERRIEGIFSATVVDVKNDWKTCGKGTDEAYCLASAYGESVEHLCSHMAYDRKALSKEAKEYLDFERYPDEKFIDIDDIPDMAPEVYSDMRDAFNRLGEITCERKRILEAWKKYLKAEKTTFAPYYSVRKRKVVYLPEKIIGSLCGSNGGGAGNTPAEAIGHGLDEITERYVKYMIYKKRLTPPSVAMEYIASNYIELYRLIKKIEEKFKVKIIVKDASMGKGYTVVSVLMINTRTQQYMVNFGAHPRFEIALERCLTEMFQFYKGNDSDYKHKSMVRWHTWDEKVIDSARNWVSLLRDDTGIVPGSFFAGKPSWEFEPWKSWENYSNSIGVKEQINILLSNTDQDIFIRNISFLGFPVYRIYIPGISTSFLPMDNIMVNITEECMAILNTLRESRDITIEQKELLKSFLDSDYSMGYLIFREVNENLIDSFCVSLIYDSGDRTRAIRLLEQIDNNFCRCALKDMELCNQGVCEARRNELLGLFFGENEMQYAMCWREASVFEALMKWNNSMKKGQVKGKSEKSDVNTLHKKIKEKMIETICNQQDIDKIIW